MKLKPSVSPTTEDVFQDVFREMSNRVLEAKSWSDVHIRKNVSGIAWLSHYEETNEWKLRWTRLKIYNSIAFRLTNKGDPYWIPNKMRPLCGRNVSGGECFPKRCEFELSFAIEDVPEFLDGFIQFTESAFEHPKEEDIGDIWQWPLFPENSFPCYAWSERANKKQKAIEEARSNK